MPEERTLKTAARYLGLKGDAAMDGEMRSLLLRAYTDMQRVATPRHVLKRFALADWQQGEAMAIRKTIEKTVTSEAMKASEAGESIQSDEACEPMKASEVSESIKSGEAYALLATLGMGVDLLIRRMAVTDSALAAAVSACASAYIDEYIDDVLKAEGERLLRERGEFFTPRFSPGYGDMPLSMQPALLLWLGAEKLGVYLTETFFMIPEKSVSAFLGITKEPRHGCHTQCERCARTDCAFREE